MSNQASYPPVGGGDFVGSVTVTNFPAVQAVSGTVTVVQPSGVNLHVDIDNFPSTQNVNVTNASLAVTGTFFQATQPISGSVSVSNFPATQPVSGSVSVSNFPATTTVVQTLGSNLHVDIDNFPSTQNVNVTNASLAVTGTFFQATQPVSGTVAVSNFPATQPVSGSVSVSNFPSTTTVVQPLGSSLHVDVDNFPSTQNVNVTNASVPVTGTFFQTTQPVSGTVTVVQPTASSLNVDVANFPATQPISGTVAVTQSTSPWVVSGTVTANAGTNLNTSALALDTSVNGILVAQGSTTVGEKGPLIQGAVTTAAPTYTTADTNPLSLTTAGALRVDASSTTQPISGSVSVSNFPATTTVVQASGANLHVDVDNFPSTQNVNVTNASIPVTGTFFQTTQPVSGTVTVVQPTAASLNVDVGNFPATQSISGTVTVTNTSFIATQSSGANLHVDVDNFPATQPISGSVSVSNFPATQPVSGTGTFAVSAASLPLPTGAATSANQTNASQKTQIVDGSGNVIASTSNALNVDVTNFPATQAVSGTVAVSAIAGALPAGTNALGSVSVSNFPATQPVSGTVTSNQGTANTVANAWPVKITDGTSVTGVAPASTAATATQPAEVVALSPNSPLPTGTNTIGSLSNISGTISLPTGAATSANQTNASQKTQIVDGSGNVVASTGNALNVITTNASVVKAQLEDNAGNPLFSYNGQLATADIVNTGLSSGSITVSTTAVAARVGASNLANRKMLMIAPITGTVYLGASNAVTTATGIPIFPNNVISFAFSTNVTPFLIAAASTTVNIFEAS